MDILKKYDFKLPIISNQKYNLYLKILGAFCDIKKEADKSRCPTYFCNFYCIG